MTTRNPIYKLLCTLLETPHVIVAAAIAYKIGNPAIALPLALGSHLILEKVPHWNPHLNTEIKKFGKLTPLTMKIIFTDTILALICGVIIAMLAMPDTTKALIVLFACLLGVLPDLVEAPYYIWHKKNRILDKLIKFQKSIQNDTGVLPGVATQVITAMAGFWWILN